MVFRIGKGKARAYACLLSIAATGESRANYVDLGVKGESYHLEAVYHAKNGIHAIADLESVGIGYGIKESEFIIIGGVTAKIDNSDNSHFLYGSYQPKTINVLYDVKHTKEEIEIGFTYFLSNDWGVRLASNSNNQLSLVFRKQTR